VKRAFAGDVAEEEAYWDYALGLADSWDAMSHAPLNAVQDTVREIAGLADTLASKIAAHSADLKTMKGYLDVDTHTFLRDDLRDFAAELRESGPATEALLVRPRSMSKASAQRTYVARALTMFLLESGHQPLAGLVAATACALLDLDAETSVGAKEVRDVTEDICRRSKMPRPARRPSRILDY
jgi:hypothetical protein